MPKRADTPPQEAGFMRRIGSRAGFFVAAIGLVFAAYQVQGWKMPRLLAALLIASMLAVAGVALLSIVWEAVKEARVWRERRETSRDWIAAEPPGLLDYLPDMNRASKKFVRQMDRLNRDTERVGKRTTRDARIISWASRLGRPRAAQLSANRSAKGILRSAVFIEKRSNHLRKTVDEFARAQEGPSDSSCRSYERRRTRCTGRHPRDLASRTATTAAAIKSVGGYRDTVRKFSQQNYSRTLKASNND
jgi:hypothetical protein